MNAVLYPVCALASLLALIYRLRILLKDRSPAQVGLVGVFFFTTWTWVVPMPWFWLSLSDAFGIPNFSGLLSHLGVVALTACQQIVLLHLSYGHEHAWRQARPRLIALAIAGVTLVILFSVTLSHFGEHPTNFAVAKAAATPWYLTIYLITFAGGQIDIARLCWNYSKIAPTTWLLRGLHLLVSSTILFGLYILGRAGDVVAGLLHSTGQAWEPATLVIVAVASVIQTAAWLTADIGPRLSERWAWLNPRTYHELTNLHEALTSAVKDVVLAVDTDGRRARLYRLVVENRDAQWALRFWMDPAVTAAAAERVKAAGLDGEDLAAAVEAAQLRAALSAVQRQERPSSYVNTPKQAEPRDFAAELAFQRKIARAFMSSPIVDQVASQQQRPMEEPR